jgi:hypothetical protein
MQARRVEGRAEKREEMKGKGKAEASKAKICDKSTRLDETRRSLASK